MTEVALFVLAFNATHGGNCLDFDGRFTADPVRAFIRDSWKPDAVESCRRWHERAGEIKPLAEAEVS